MFTGIVKDKGRIKYIRANELVVESSLQNLKKGGSLMVDGVCLTLTDINDNIFKMDIGRETLKKTSLRNLRPGSKVNLEPAMKLTDRIDGHIVYGHVFGTGKVESLKHKGNTIIITVQAPQDIIGKLFEKGSVAVNGVSLTLNEVRKNKFSVGIVPETAQRTSLGELSAGKTVNIEPDMIIAAAKG